MGLLKGLPATVLLAGITLQYVDAGEADQVPAEAQEPPLAREPVSPITQENLARELMFTGRPDEAKRTVLAGLEQNPNSASLHAVMADILRWVEQRFDESLRWARAAARLDPLDPGRKEVECELLLQLGMDDEAEACLDDLEKSFPELIEPALVSIRRDLYLMRGQPQEAVNYVEQVAPGKSNEGFQWLLGETYVLNDNFNKARPIYEQLRPEFFAAQNVVVPPYKVGSAITVGQILYAGGEPEKAEHLFDRALETMSSMDRTLYGFIDADIYMTRGDRKAAIDALQAGYEAGVVGQWWYLRAPVYDVMRKEPQWEETAGLFLAEIRRQREHYQQTKDDPLM